MEIKTNNRWKRFKYQNEVPARILRDQFDYQSEEDGTDEFVCSDSFFSGIVIRVSSDGEMYQIGTYFS